LDTRPFISFDFESGNDDSDDEVAHVDATPTFGSASIRPALDSATQG
jgi:hypothetical protein